MSETAHTEQLFYDPFAEEGEQFFDAAASFDAIKARYQSGDVEHDYTADKFVSDTQALMLDAHFVGQFEQAQAIAARMHELCGEDHALREALQASGPSGSEDHAAHGHSHLHDTYTGKNDEETDPKTGKKKKKKDKKKSGGWAALLLRQE